MSFSIEIKNKVDKLYRLAPDRKETLRRCPVTKGSFTVEDRLVKLKKKACLALAAMEQFASETSNGYSLPLSYIERENLKGRFDEGYIVALYARSLAVNSWDLRSHPEYQVYASGILALPDLGHRIIKTVPELARRYPPKNLPALNLGVTSNQFKRED